MNMPSPHIEQQLSAMDHSVQEIIDRIDKVHGPHWEARSDLVRNLVGIGAAIFAGAITFSDQILDTTAPNQTLLVLASWILMLVSIAAGLVVLWQSATLRSFYPKYFNQRDHIRDRLAVLDPNSPALADESTAIFKEVIDGAVNPLGTADKVGHHATHACIGLFLASLLCFLVFAVWNVCAELDAPDGSPVVSSPDRPPESVSSP